MRLAVIVQAQVNRTLGAGLRETQPRDFKAADSKLRSSGTLTHEPGASICNSERLTLRH